ncbi:MAG: polymer-forming cytoskeletal protein [Rhodospirillales bacterium]
MFSKNSKDSSSLQAASAPRSSVPSIISIDLTVQGNLISEGEIQLDGSVTGDVTAHALTIGQNGTVNGEIDAETIRVHGTVNGQIRAKSVFLAKSARVRGDVVHESLAIEPGALLEGHCKRMTSLPDASKAPKSKTNGAKSEDGKINLIVADTDTKPEAVPA